MTDQEFFQKCDNLERQIKQLEARLDKIKTESEPKFEPEFERLSYGEPYFYIYGNNMNVAVSSDDSDYTSEVCYMHNNYFHTEKRAQEVANKIKFLLKLERLHDIYCPDYKPNWEDTGVHKYYVYYDGVANRYFVSWRTRCIPQPDVFFPTEGIAQKVCDILNKELKQNSAH